MRRARDWVIAHIFGHKCPTAHEILTTGARNGKVAWTDFMHFAIQLHRIADAERHLAFIDYQIRRMQEAFLDGDPVDTKELRGLVSDASKLRKEIRDELKPTMSLGDIQITPPKKYGGQSWFGEDEEEGDKT